LTTGEKILYRTGLHWTVLIAPVIFGGFFVLVGTLTLIGADFARSGGPGLFIVGFGALVIAFAVMTRRATEMTVTSNRVIIKFGLLRRKTIEIFLSKVESIGVEQGLMGRMLG